MADWAVRTAFTATDKVSPAFNQMSGASAKFGAEASQNIGVVNKSLMALKGMLPVIGAAMVGAFINSTVEAAVKMERLATGFKAVFEGDATRQMQFVRNEANRLGLEFMSTAEAYKSISAAAKGSAIDNKMVQQVFLGVAEAATSLQLSSDESEGALRAISQMISKGKVQAEELRGQLGERLPGAFQIAARSMGMTTAQLDKFMSDGKLTAELFIPKFAAQLRKEYGKSAMDAANSFSAASNRFKNLTTEMKVGIGTTLLPALNDLMTAFMPVIDVMGQFFRENREGISAIIKVVPWLVGAFIAWKGAIWGVTAAQTAMNLVGWISYLWMMRSAIATAITMTKAWTVAQAVFAVVMNLGLWPILAIIAAVAALVAAGYFLIKNWGKVKEFFAGLWTGIVDGFNSAIEWIVAKFTAVVEWVSQKWQSVKSFFGFANDAGNKADNARGMNAPNRAATELQAGNTNVNIYSNGTEAKAEVTPRRGATVNMKRLGYQQ